MPRTARAKPRDLVADWPTAPADDEVGEVARRFAVNLREAIGEASIRSIAKAAGLNHATLIGILDGQKWPDLQTIAKIERGLDKDVWPGRVKPSAR
jgi:lambda repressor-like predicted transcriptional regulator